MKKALHKAISILMAFVVMVSTMSFTINMHYCGGTLVATSFFSDVESCGMEQAMATARSGCSMTKPDCCKNEQSIVKGQEELKLNFEKLSLEPHVFVAVFSHTYNNLFEDFANITPSSNDYPPPKIVRQLYKLDESYII
jgi:hypothetical protein